jgi:hypothetical protein
MIVGEEIWSSAGLLANRGQEVTYPLVVRLKNFHRRRLIKDEVLVLVAKHSDVGERKRAAGNHAGA